MAKITMRGTYASPTGILYAGKTYNDVPRQLAESLVKSGVAIGDIPIKPQVETAAKRTGKPVGRQERKG